MCSFVFIKVYRKFYILLLKKSNTKRTSFPSSLSNTQQTHTHTHFFDAVIVFVVFVLVLADLSAILIYILNLSAGSYFKTKIFPRAASH